MSFFKKTVFEKILIFNFCEFDVSVSTVRNITVLMASTLHPSVNTSTVQSYWPTIQVNFCQEIMMIVSHPKI